MAAMGVPMLVLAVAVTMAVVMTIVAVAVVVAAVVMGIVAMAVVAMGVVAMAVAAVMAGIVPAMTSLAVGAFQERLSQSAASMGVAAARMSVGMRMA
mmetsp:Transcript_8984/g.23437  ORF Transcript_8984/g.23437 Transcript_8984/m.23437 type:complete len:97 (+) Transcript_8984:1089-1379(+)